MSPSHMTLACMKLTKKINHHCHHWLFLQIIVVCVCMRVRVCTRARVCCNMHADAYSRTAKLEGAARAPAQLPPNLFPGNRVSHWSWSYAGSQQDPVILLTPLHLPQCWTYRLACNHIWVFNRSSGIWAQVPLLGSSSPTEPSPQPIVFVLMHCCIMSLCSEE